MARKWWREGSLRRKKRAEVEILCWEERDLECGGARRDKEAAVAAEAMSWWRLVAEDEDVR